jgi:hypothetical protein
MFSLTHQDAAGRPCGVWQKEEKEKSSVRCFLVSITIIYSQGEAGRQPYDIDTLGKRVLRR